MVEGEMERWAWMSFRKKKRKAPDREALKAKLDDIRDKRKSDARIADDEVTGVISLALQQLSDAVESSSRTTGEAVDNMRKTGLRVASSDPPPPMHPED
jgi:hypothetical protein